MASQLDLARDSFAQLPTSRKAILAAVVLGVMALLIGVSRYATKPDMALLFGSLPAEDAGPIVGQLDAQGVAYELRDGGASIFVPRDKVYELRLSMASEGLVSNGPAGYELFDTGTLGMTDFMQRLNVKRALEGELARTIGSIDQVRSARVHLVLPERSPFRDQQVSPSASVVLNVSGTIASDRVAGVTALVAGAVEGMSPSDVTVLDEAGRMLAGPDGGGAEAGMTTAQLRMRQEVETYLAGAGQSMLDKMLGPGRAVVKVSAELDLARTATERNSIDPESQTVISEEKLEEAGEGTASNSTVRNFEVTRERTTAEQEAGQVKVLTVSVLLDEAAPPTEPVAEGAEAPAATPFTAQQLQQIESLVKNAVGFDTERGDRFAVQQIRFSDEARAGEMSDAASAQRSEMISMAIRYGIMLLALFLAYRLLKGLAGRVNSAPPPAPESPDGELAMAAAEGAPGAEGALPSGTPRTVIESVVTDVLSGKMSPEARARLADAPDLLATVTEHIEADSEAAVALIRSWLEEEESIPTA